MFTRFLLCLCFVAVTGVEVFPQTVVPENITGCRFLTLNSVIRVNQIEVSHSKTAGWDEREFHTPETMKAFRNAVTKGFPNGRITWAFTWKALNDQSDNYKELRKLAVDYHKQYGDDVTYFCGGFFPNAYSDRATVSKELHAGLEKVRELVGDGFNPKSVVAGFLAAENLKYLADIEQIHVCQGNIFSQFSIDNQDGDGAPCYPYYPSTEHFCKPAQGKDDFIDCVNLDGWTVDFLAARRQGYAGGFNSRLGVGPIETFRPYGYEKGLEEILHTTSINFDDGVQRNGFGWVTVCWELCLLGDSRYKPKDGTKMEVALENWLAATKERWKDTIMITQGEFGELWRKHDKDNSFDYRFVEQGSGIGGSDKDKEIRWYMNKDFRMATLKKIGDNSEPLVIDFTDYTKPAEEPQGLTRKWSLLGDINQKGTRPQDKPIPLDQLTEKQKQLLKKWKIY
ncbi:MAG: DUF3863 domain-containing protein [Planctomycetaceae bacterium]|jgi:hypothetical protein|nr:DUF3863 domain-containing protein [Planctomycetaceae bacterium]